MGAFRLVVVDTFAAFFDGKNVNDPVEGGNFMRRHRPFTLINGKPAVIIACHPVKNAPEDNLIPYGSGAILNEDDGNLTLWKNPATGWVALHYQGKLRGIEFDPIMFRFEITGSPDVLDKQGRQVLMPVLVPATIEDAERRERDSEAINAEILQTILANPGATQREWAATVGRNQSNLYRRLNELAKQKLVERTLGKWGLTAKGRKAIGGKEEAAATE